MKTEEIIERLRHPKKYARQAAAAKAQTQSASAAQAQQDERSSWIAWIVALSAIAIAALAWMVVLQAKNRAENVTAALDPTQIQGLSSETEFNPSQGVTYVQIYEGQDRNVSVDELGTTLPIISRYNYQAITPKNYGIIGLAPWALTENFAANLQDTELIRYLLNRKEVGEAFITREDVAPLLADPQLLAGLAQDTATLEGFLNSNVISQMLANPDMVRAVGDSRFMSYLLTSKAVKYYRDHPQEAVKLIEASAPLSALAKNEGIRKAVTENYYLKPIAGQLLGTSAKAAK